ncbi:MAG: class I SAM-dependent methyltransferase [Candidatus Sumerlaeia bacterium]
MSVQDRNPEYKADQRQVFDEMISEDWHTYLTPESVGLWKYEARLLLGRLTMKDIAVLDVGCGCGFHDYEMALSPKVKSIRAIDYSPKSIERARQEFAHGKIDFEVDDIFQMRPDGAYDLVVSFQVIEHLEDPQVFLEQLRDFCKPGGMLGIFTVDRMRPYNRIRARYDKAPELDDPMHKREFVMEELEQMGKTAGMETVFRCKYAAGPTKWIPSCWRPAMGRLFPHLGTRLFILLRRSEK